MSALSLRLHHVLSLSYANGPGPRAAIWVQGCSLNCPGCFNPETHPFEGGKPVLVDDLFDWLRANAARYGLEGVSFSGGEPLEQMRPLLYLLERVRAETELSVLLFTGYTWDEVTAMPDGDTLLERVDVLIAGRYDAAQRLTSGLRGSANQTMHILSPRYSLADIEAVPPGEIVISTEGEVLISGICSVRW